jgi:hypothetical protein
VLPFKRNIWRDEVVLKQTRFFAAQTQLEQFSGGFCRHRRYVPTARSLRYANSLNQNQRCDI